MDFGSKLDELNLTRDEMNRFGEALKDEKFRALLKEYAEEISDPENRRRYEEEITQLERDRGMDVQFIHPEAHHVLKTRCARGKIFINICSNPRVDVPSCEAARDRGGKPGHNWRLPFSLTPGRADRDAAGNSCEVYDVVFHPDALHMATKNARFMELIHSTAVGGIEDSSHVQLDRDRLKQLKIRYKGVAHPAVIRRPIPGHDQKNRSAGEDMLSFPYPDENPTEPEPRSPPKPEDTRSKQPIEPHYTVKYRSVVDLQDYRCSRDSGPGARPREIVVIIDVPLLGSAQDADLSVTERRLVLEAPGPAYRLELPLAYPVDEERGDAKFNKTRKQLTITLPVRPVETPEIQRIGCDETKSDVNEEADQKPREGLDLDHTEDLDLDHTEEGLNPDHTEGLDLDHTEDLDLDHTEDLDPDHTEDLDLDHTEGLDLDHTEDLDLDHTEDLDLDHTEEGLNPDHTEGLDLDHTEDLDLDHTEEGLNPDHTEGLDLDHTEDLDLDHTEDLDPDHTEDLDPDHTEDLDPDHTEDLDLDHTEEGLNPDHTEGLDLDHTEDLDLDHTDDVLDPDHTEDLDPDHTENGLDPDHTEDGLDLDHTGSEWSQQTCDTDTGQCSRVHLASEPQFIGLSSEPDTHEMSNGPTENRTEPEPDRSEDDMNIERAVDSSSDTSSVSDSSALHGHTESGAAALLQTDDNTRIQTGTPTDRQPRPSVHQQERERGLSLTEDAGTYTDTGHMTSAALCFQNTLCFDLD